MTKTKKPTQCPNCHKPNGVFEILWGMPNAEDDLDKYWIGGCIVPDLEPWPDWHCEHCDFEWR